MADDPYAPYFPYAPYGSDVRGAGVDSLYDASPYGNHPRFG